MSNLRLDFERELKFKITQKSKSNQPEETQLVKAFRYFDLDNSGTVSQDEFCKAVQKIGVTSFEKGEILQLFDIYDTSRDGQLDYREFSAILFGGAPQPSEKATPEKTPSRKLSSTSSVQTQQSQSDYNEYKPWTYKASQKGSEEKKKVDNSLPNMEEVRQNLPSIFQRFRQRLGLKGVRGFINLYRLFMNVDYDEDGIITNKEFLKILRDFKMELTEEDSMYLFAHFDRDRRGEISFENFMTNVLGSFTPEKKDIVNSVWKKLDPHKGGKIPIGDVRAMLKDLRNHPDVKSGRKSEDQIVADYWDLLDFHHSAIENSKSQYITQKELEGFLLYISAVVEDERYFEMIVQTTFKLATEKNYEDTYAGAGRKDYNPKLGYLNDFHRSKFQGGSVSANAPFGTQQNVPKISEEARPRTSQYGYNPPETSGYQNISRDRDSYSEVSEQRFSGQDILRELQQKILGRGIRGILNLTNLLRRRDEDRLRSLPVTTFIKVLKDFKTDMGEDDLRNMLSYLNLNKNARVDYDAFLGIIKGDLSKQRRGLIVGTYERICKDKRGYVTIEDLKELFNPAQHPDVRNGRRSEDEILMEFFETFELFHDMFTVSTKGRDSRVSMEEFVAYYENVSSVVGDDRQFEKIINDCWRRSYKSSHSWEDDTNDSYSSQAYRKSYTRNY